MAGAYSFLGGTVGGAYLDPVPHMIAIAGSVAVASLALRRTSGSAVLICLAALGFALSGTTARIKATEGDLADLAARVPSCHGPMRVLERGMGHKTLVEVHGSYCGARAGGGVAIIDGAPGVVGGVLTLEALLVPLGTDDFSKALRRSGVEARLSNVTILATAPPTSPALKAAESLRRGVATAGARMGTRQAALLGGLTIGDTTGLDPTTEMRMRAAGLTHLVAVSGSNVAIVVGAVLLLMRRRSRPAAIGIAALCLLVYTLAVGPEPSVLRAATMGTIGLAALATGRRVGPQIALAVALSFVVIVRPYMVHSVGLQLSAAATAGLILWAESLARRMPLLPRPVALIAGATLAAQFAVAPVLLLAFGEISLVAPLANLVAVPAVGVVTVAGLAAGVVAVAAPAWGSALGRLVEPGVAWILGVGDVLGSLPVATVELPRWIGWVLLPPTAYAAATAVRRSYRVAAD